MKSKAILLLFILIIVSIFYFSWIPDSQLASERYLPQWLRDWSNSNFNLRTAVPFVGFGFLLENLFAAKATSTKYKPNFNSWFRNSAIALALVCLAEGGQFFISNRHPDVMDVWYGFLGSQLGFATYWIYKSQ